MWAKSGAKSGFTIVELLIVIVVIAILAVITVTSFNGITARANNSHATAVLADYIKAYNLYAADNGGYPQLNGCLGSGYSGVSCLSQSGTSACWGMGGSSVSSTGLANALKPYTANKVPAINTQEVACGGTTYIGMYGYYNTTTSQAQVYAFFNGSGSCPAMSGNVQSILKSTGDNGYRCTYYLNQ